MSDLSAYLGNKVVRWLAGNAFPAAPATVYVALFNGDPAGAGTEVTTSVNAGGRQAAAWAAPAAGTTNNMSNNADTNFGASAGSATIDHVALYDAASGGNLLFSHAIASVSVTAGTTVKVSSGAMTVTVGAPGA